MHYDTDFTYTVTYHFSTGHPVLDPSGRNWVNKSLLYFFLTLVVLCALNARQSCCQLLLVQQNLCLLLQGLRLSPKTAMPALSSLAQRWAPEACRLNYFPVAQYHVKTVSVSSGGSEDIWCPSAEDMVRMKRDWWRASLPPESHRSFSCSTLPKARLVQNRTARLCSKQSCARNPIYQLLSPLP